MKREARRVAMTLGVLGGVLLAAPPAARADTPPGLWGSAREPGARARYDLHVRARQVLEFDARVELAKYGALDHLRALLEDAHAETSPDVRLRFDLGEVYYRLDLLAEAVRVLEPALRAHEGHPAAADALMTLAVCYGKLDRPREEHDTYQRYLKVAVDLAELPLGIAVGGPRANATLNLAESEMRLGNLRDAVAGYEEALALTGKLPATAGAHQTAALAVWGLAVALDRAREASRARAAASRALGLDPALAIIGQDKNVFFVPAYERLWYLALGASAQAEAAQNAHEALAHRRSQELALRTYVVKATADDRWLTLAKVRLREAEALRKRAELAARAAPPLHRDPSEVFRF